MNYLAAALSGLLIGIMSTFHTPSPPEKPEVQKVESNAKNKR